MCRDIAPEQMQNYLKMYDCGKDFLQEIRVALMVPADQLSKHIARQLQETREFLEERQLVFEALVGYFNDTRILITPYGTV